MKKFLIDLDILLDTRLSVIANYNQTVAKQLLANDAYRYRESDQWDKLTNGVVSNELFKELYDNRGGDNSRDTIEASVIANMVPVIHRLIGEELATHLDNKDDDKGHPILVVNYYPYVLNTEERDTLVGIIKDLFGKDQQVELVNLNMKSVSPRYLYDNVALVIMYEMHDWIKLHYESLTKLRAGSVTFLGPKLFEKDVSELETEDKKQQLQLFKMIHLQCMNFDYINAEYFSAIKI